MKGQLAFITRLICGVNARWLDGAPREGRCIYFSNHTSHLDSAVLWSTLPAYVRANTRPVAAQEYWNKNWFRRWLARVFNAILVNRVRVTKEHNPIRILRKVLDEGSSLIVFPEGTRSTDGQIRKFKSGLYHLARDMPELDLIPVYTENLTRILPKGEFLPVPVMSSITFGKAIQYHKDERRDDFLARARQAILDMQPS
jgi:1-acyl-sn-glycerol-3-phosphate acyltransferase